MTPEYADTPSAVRYADFDFDVARRCVYCVREGTAATAIAV